MSRKRRESPARNPLRRTSDRIEAWLTFLTIMTTLMLAPWAGWWAARVTYQEDVQASEWERLHVFQVVAVLLQDPSIQSASMSDGQLAPSTVPTSARWIGPDRATHIGVVFADIGQRAGSAVTAWVDERGVPTGPPGHRNAMADSAMVGLLVILGIAVQLAAVRR